jgi:curli biogenesis system outer membrane secretion channel CsgG
MKRNVVVLAVLMLQGFSNWAVAQDKSSLPTLAIANIEVTPGGWTLPPPQLGGAIVELLVDELVTSQRFHLYDGQWLVPEAEAGGRVNLERLRAAAAERHVDYLVLGGLTAFSAEHGKKRYGGLFPKPFLLGGFSREQAQLRVAMTFRIVDVRTGEVVATASGEGIGRRKATALGGLGVVHGLPLGALAGAARIPAARDVMLDEAVRMAVHNAALELARRSPPGAGQ